MARWKGTLALAAALLGAAPLVAQTPESEIETRIRALYAVYRADNATGHLDNLSIYSQRTAALIRQWQTGLPTDEVTDMADFDWFCQCQDWDSQRFSATELVVRKEEGGVYAAHVGYDLGWGEKRALDLILIREDNGWTIDDIRFGDQTPPLRAALVAEIEANRR